MRTSAQVVEKLTALRNRLEELQPGLIALSGGVDSRLLHHATRLWRMDFLFAHAVGPHQSEGEKKQIQLRFQADESLFVVPFDPLLLSEVRSNSRERCYWCKKALFGTFQDMAARKGLRFVLDGTQTDDLRTHRPGHGALRELAIQSPFVQADMSKSDIRQAAVLLELDEPEQPSRACLLTRFPYDHLLSQSDLEIVGHVEDNLASLGLRRFRFRIIDRETNLLQIHPDDEALWQDRGEEIQTLISTAGFPRFTVSVTLNLSGYFDAQNNHSPQPQNP